MTDTLTNSAVPDFAQARELAAKYTDFTNPQPIAAATQVARYLIHALDTIELLRVSLADMETETTKARDAVHRVRLFCSRGPVIFAKDVRAILDSRP